MRHVFSSSKFITYTYYGEPVDHVTVELSVSEELSVAVIELLKLTAQEELKAYPVESFPVAGAYVTLMPRYCERHPRLISKINA